MEKGVESGHPIYNITGVILAGGQSRRFGSNKALAAHGGKPLIQHVTEIISSLFSSCLLVTNTPETYSFIGIPMIGDIYLDMGPLAGIHAALVNIKTDWAFVTACDMPRLNPVLIKYLCGLAAEQFDAVTPWPAGGPEPLYGLYHKKCLPIIEKRLQKKQVAIHKALAELSVRRVDDEEMRGIGGYRNTFHNINRPEDLAPDSGK
jgi:molybdopterin-guanine dinucleotide biosynthesis protein A